MKVVSLLEPWAYLWATQQKKLETRSWATKYRGRMGLHASKGFVGYNSLLCFQEPFLSALLEVGIGAPAMLPKGAIIATFDLVDVIPITPGFVTTLSPKEIAFGDYTPSRFAWVPKNMKLLPEPIPVKGQLGLWEYDL